MNKVIDIRNIFIEKFKNKEFEEINNVKTIEIIGESFIADEDWIVRKPNYDYVKREIAWYESQSLDVNDIPGDTPTIWQNVSSHKDEINSNYGYLIWSKNNFSQYNNVLKELRKNPSSRRASMIYNRPSMHYDYCKNGMNDFVCTFANQFFIRDNKLISHYIMRSNDVVFGYTCDVLWAGYVQQKLANDLQIEIGELIWTASSLHVYERHFNHIEKLIENE